MNPALQMMVARLQQLAAEGKTRQQAADEIGGSYTYVVRVSIRHDINFERQIPADQPERRVRAADMRSRYEAGETLIQIGQRYDMTRERVRQILTKRFGTTAKDGGKAEIGRQKRREFRKKREARSQKMWGCSYSDYQRLLKRPEQPTYLFSQQRKNASQREIGWELSLWQWWKIWEQSGHWHERGNGRGYQMCRLNDKGPYAVDNVYIATGVENMQDHWVSRRATEAA